MRSRLTAIARVIGAYVPDATSIAVLMALSLLIASVLTGTSLAITIDALYRGLWMLLPFSMQVVLMLVLCTVLSTTPFFRRLIEFLAARPTTTTQVVFAAVLGNAALSYLYWGLGIALGPLIAAHFARAAEARGIRVDFPCLLAAQFGATAVSQYSLSSAAALLVATPGHFLEATTGVMPLGSTIWSPAALTLVTVYPLALAICARILMPRDAQPLSAFPNALTLLETSKPSDPASTTEGARGAARWAETTRVLPLLLSVVLGYALWHQLGPAGKTLDLNAMITALLIAALVFTGTLAAFGHALQSAVQSCWQVLILYQLYGAVAGMLQYTNLGPAFATGMASLATPMTFPFVTALAGALVAVFVPSSGGQWIIQGFVTSQAAAAVGVAPQLGLLSLGVGDQMGNLISPFWLIVVAGIARVDFRPVFGYAVLFALLWFVLGVAAFTFITA